MGNCVKLAYLTGCYGRSYELDHYIVSVSVNVNMVGMLSRTGTIRCCSKNSVRYCKNHFTRRCQEHTFFTPCP